MWTSMAVATPLSKVACRQQQRVWHLLSPPTQWAKPQIRSVHGISSAPANYSMQRPYYRLPPAGKPGCNASISAFACRTKFQGLSQNFTISTSNQTRLFSEKGSSGNKDTDTKDSERNSTPLSTPKKILSKLPISKHENIYTIPNILTFTRFIAAPMIGYCILHSNYALALSLFAYASITDLVDGYIARKFNQQTVVGTVIDPMADKFLMTVGVICLAMKSAMPIWLAGLILARDVGLAISAIYYRWISLPPPKTMTRYWDFSLPSAEVKPTGISKANTALQLLLIGSTVAMPVVPEAVLAACHLQEALVGLQYLVALTTTWSGLSYVYSKDAVRILSREEAKEKQKTNTK